MKKITVDQFGLGSMDSGNKFQKPNFVSKTSLLKAFNCHSPIFFCRQKRLE